MNSKKHQSIAALCWTTFLMLSLPTLAVHADFNGSDNFSSGSSKWTAVINAGSGNLTVANGRYEYTATGAGTNRDHAISRWNVNQGSYTNDWAVQVDVHLDAFPGLFTGLNSQNIDLNLSIMNGTNQTQSLSVAIERDYSFRGFYTGTSTNDVTTEVPNTTTDAALRISFDSAAKTLTAWYDADGAANGYTWIPIETVSISTGTNNWGMTASSQFSVLIGVGSGVSEGTGPDMAVTGAQAYFDNFLATNASGGHCPTNSFVVENSGWGFSASAAFDGTNYLVGFQHGVIADQNTDIKAQLISQSGAKVGPLISTGRTGGAPRVAFDGTNYLLVWPDDGFSYTTRNNDYVYGQFVSRAGALVGSPLVISGITGGTVSERPTGLCFDGNNYLVMYGIETNATSGETSYHTLAARFVSPAGSVGSEITIATGPPSGDGSPLFRENVVAFNGTNYLVTYFQHNGGDSDDVYGMLVTKTGTLSAPFRISSTTSPSHNPLTVGSDGSNFFVVWPFDTGLGYPNPTIWELQGRVITASGGFGSPEITVAGVTTGQHGPMFPCIAFDGVNYLVTWTDMSNSNDWNIAGQFVTKAGTLLGSTLSLVTCPGNQAISPVVYGAGKDLVAWADGLTADSGANGTAIKGLFISVGSTNITPPNGGSITSPLFSGTNGLYDLTGFITGFDLTMAMNPDYDIAEDIRVVQSITGAFTAGDTGTVMTVNANGSVDVSVAYTLKGSLAPKGTHLAGTLNFSCKGTGVYGTDGPKQYGEKLTSTFTLDPVTGNLTGQTTGTTSKSGKGTAKLTTTALPPITLTPVEWSLSMTLITKVTKVTGTATVNLANGRSFPFTVNGTTKNGVSKLTLTGTVTSGTGCTDSGKGAKLTVTLTGNHITGISGSLLGQKVNLSKL